MAKTAVGSGDPEDSFSPESLDSRTAELLNKMVDKVQSPELVDPREMQMQIASRILSAESVDDVLAAGEGGAASLDTIVGRPFEVTDISWHRAAEKFRQNSLGVFAVVTVKMLDDGSTNVITSGGTNVLVQLYRMEELGGLFGKPMRSRKVETSQGYDTYWLAPVA